MQKINLFIVLLLGFSPAYAALAGKLETPVDRILASVNKVSVQMRTPKMSSETKLLQSSFSAFEAIQKTEKDNLYKNSLSAEFGGTGVVMSLGYERLIPLTSKVALAPRIGIGNALFFLNGIGELNFVIGTKHALETGAGICIAGNVTFLEIDDYAPYQYTLRLGYRYTKMRAYIRTAPMLIIDANGEGAGNYGIRGAFSFGYRF